MLYKDDRLVPQVVKRVIIFTLIVIGILFFTVKNPKPYVLGLIFGSLISILSFRLMELSTKKAVNMAPNKAYNYAIGQYFIRYSIYFVVLVIAALADYLNIFTVLLGLIMVKIVILSDTIYDTIKESIKSKKDG